MIISNRWDALLYDRYREGSQDRSFVGVYDGVEYPLRFFCRRLPGPRDPEKQRQWFANLGSHFSLALFDPSIEDERGVVSSYGDTAPIRKRKGGKIMPDRIRIRIAYQIVQNLFHRDLTVSQRLSFQFLLAVTVSRTS